MPPMKILIAPDKFKGALNAREVAENIVKGLSDVLPRGPRKLFATQVGALGWNAKHTIRLGVRSRHVTAGLRTKN